MKVQVVIYIRGTRATNEMMRPHAVNTKKYIKKQGQITRGASP